MPDCRRFTRIIFSTPVKLSGQKGIWKTELVDVSLKGALVKTPGNWHSVVGEQFTLSFVLAGSDIDIHMLVHKAHQIDNCIGFTCDSIDIDSASHLRRLIELNVGNADLLNRDLEHLSHPQEA
jgi:hypothetical protein